MKTYAILPYKGLIDIAEETINEYNIKLQVVEGHVEGAIPAALSAEKSGADVIISRGGTAEIIQRHVHVPVVKIRVSDLDLLRILYPLKGLDKKILVVGFKNAVYRARSVARVLGLNIQELLIPYEQDDYNFDSVKYTADRLIGKYGIDTIIGDQTAYVNLQSFCESQYLITSSKEDFIEAIEQTKLSSNISIHSHADFGQVQSVLDAVHDVIVSTDDKGIITIFNKPAEKLFNFTQQDAVGMHLVDVIGKNTPFSPLSASMMDVLTTRQPKCEYVKNGEENGTFVINTNPLMVDNITRGTVATIKELSPSQQRSHKPQKRTYYTQGFRTRYTFDDVLTRNDELLKKIEIAKGYANTDATVLIEGESGVGKELFAQSIHSASARCCKPFVAVNCAAIPASLLESELFGYENGAFTGATKNGKVGLFEMANQGTIFLDEISEIEPSLQVRFLRVLEEKQIMRIGSDKLIDIDVRVISATNKNLKDQVEEGRFRADLYYRLNLLNLRIPSLREHPGDIKYLANHFFSSFCKKYGMQIETLPGEVIKQLEEYSWPGNIRELKNIMERVALTIGTGCIGPPDIDLIAHEIKGSIEHEQNGSSNSILSGTMDEIKKKAAQQAMVEENYNKSRAAKRLGIDRSTLDRLLTQSP
ncbi:MAG: sigma 54-interacting transcriptional regulator [Spirochaetota bacterium]|nr:sigma 54-interacting transcriptional regulator [Spirochaetota bacterium]